MDPEVMEQKLQQWMPIFRDQAESGLNKQDWCRQNGIKRTVFFKWQRECMAYLLSKQQAGNLPKNEPAFVEINCTQKTTSVVTSNAGSDSATDSPAITISCNGFSVSVNGQVNEINLHKVLKVISHVH